MGKVPRDLVCRAAVKQLLDKVQHDVTHGINAAGAVEPVLMSDKTLAL